MKHLGPLERKRRDTAVPLAAVECGPGVPAPLSQISMSRGLGNVMKEARLVTELQTCHQPGKAMVFPVVMYGCESWTVKTRLSEAPWEVP